MSDAVERVKLYPGWLRAWHAANAILIVALAWTGLRMHLGQQRGPLMSFETALHWLLAAGAILFPHVHLVLSSMGDKVRDLHAGMIDGTHRHRSPESRSGGDEPRGGRRIRGMRFRLSSLPFPGRLAVGLFCVLLLGFHLSAQATLWVQAGAGSMPSTDEVLWKYHGNPARTKLHQVLDLSLPRSSPRAMFWYLDPQATPDSLERVEQRRSVVLDWVAAGTPRAGWEPVRQVLHEQGICLECHGVGKENPNVLLDTYEDVVRLAQPGRGMTTGALLVSGHNHLFAFSVAALLLGVLTALTGVRRGLAAALVLAAFAGAAVDVGGWFLTAAHGDPWQKMVVLGGASFGLATTLMALLVFDEVAFGGWVARRLRIARRGPEPDAA